MLFVRSHFVWAELILIINFFNLSSLYFRHPASPRFVHLPAVSGPLAWAFVALYWNGAIAFNAEGLFGRILANVAVWGILVYGLFFLVTFKVSIPSSTPKDSHINTIIGLHHWLFPQCSQRLPRCRPIPPTGHCLPVDLCLHHHGHPLRRDISHYPPRDIR